MAITLYIITFIIAGLWVAKDFQIISIPLELESSTVFIATTIAILGVLSNSKQDSDPAVHDTQFVASPNSKTSHLINIQFMILFMASKEFFIKATCFIAAIILISISIYTKNDLFLILLLITTLVSWFFDAFYLNLEIKFRCLYDKVRLQNDDNTDFSMDTRICSSHHRGILSTMAVRSLRYYYTIILILAALFTGLA